MAALRYLNRNVQKRADKNRTLNKLNGANNMWYSKVAMGVIGKSKLVPNSIV